MILGYLLLFSIQILMYSAVFITVDEFIRAFARHLSILHKAKINIFLFECKPKLFYIDVVKCPVFFRQLVFKLIIGFRLLKKNTYSMKKSSSIFL